MVNKLNKIHTFREDSWVQKSEVHIRRNLQKVKFGEFSRLLSLESTKHINTVWVERTVVEC